MRILGYLERDWGSIVVDIEAPLKVVGTKCGCIVREKTGDLILTITLKKRKDPAGE